MNDNSVKKILILAANPQDTVRLKLDREVEEIRSVLRSSSNRDRFEIEYRSGVRSSELQQHMYDVRPWIVHFSGHGHGSAGGDDARKLTAIDGGNSPEGLVFEDEDGRSQLVSGKAMANLFALFSQDIHCVVLNSCYSERQAQEIVKHVPYVVGMKREIGDLAARQFAKGFYRAIGEGLSIAGAVASGQSAIELYPIPEELTPVLLPESGSDRAMPPISSESKTSNSTGVRSTMSEGKRRRLEQEKEGLEKQANLILEKLEILRSSKAIETDPSRKFQLDKQIEQAEAELAPIDTKVEEIEEEINGNPTRSVSVMPDIDRPKTEIEPPGGAVALKSDFYIERPPMEDVCYQEIESKGALIKIKAPQQMGKSSLMIRVRDRAIELGYKAVNLDCEMAESSALNDLKQFLRWFCMSVGKELGLPNKLNEFWDDNFTNKQNCTTYFQSYILETINSPIALTLDKVDILFHCPIANDFFGLLRGWHEKSKNEPIWENLRLVVAHSQDPSYSRNFKIDSSPFGNVGVPIKLSEFTRSQVRELASRHRLSWGNAEVDDLMAMVGGHPYLVREALYQTAREFIPFERLLALAPTESGIYIRHLRHNFNLLRNNNLISTMQKLIAADRPMQLSSDETLWLDGMGLISLRNNDANIRYKLYKIYFTSVLREI